MKGDALPFPGSEIVESAELRKRKHENKTGGHFSRPANFSRALFFRVPTISEPVTG